MNYYFIALLILCAMNLGIVLTEMESQEKINIVFFTSLISCLIVIVLTYLAIQTGF